MSPNKFHHAIKCLRSKDALIYEEGYHALQGDFLRQHLDAILELSKKEADPAIRGRFIELLGDSGEPRAIPFLKNELMNDNSEVRLWALYALDCIATPEAQFIATSHRNKHPEDAE